MCGGVFYFPVQSPLWARALECEGVFSKLHSHFSSARCFSDLFYSSLFDVRLLVACTGVVLVYGENEIFFIVQLCFVVLFFFFFKICLISSCSVLKCSWEGGRGSFTEKCRLQKLGCVLKCF